MWIRSGLTLNPRDLMNSGCQAEIDLTRNVEMVNVKLRLCGQPRCHGMTSHNSNLSEHMEYFEHLLQSKYLILEVIQGFLFQLHIKPTKVLTKNDDLSQIFFLKKCFAILK